MFVPFWQISTYVNLHIGEDVLEEFITLVRINPAVDVHIGREHFIGILIADDGNDRCNIPTITPPIVDSNLFNVAFPDALVGSKTERGNLKLPNVSPFANRFATTETHLFDFISCQLHTHVSVIFRASFCMITSDSHDI